MTIYNSKAPLHYNQYWTLEDEDKELRDMASSILLNYIMDWGQKNKESLQALADVANSIGFHIEVYRHKGAYLFSMHDWEAEGFKEFVAKIRGIGRGNFESEVVQIANIIKEYRTKKRWYQFWKK